MRNSTQAHLRFLPLAAVHKVLKDRTEVLVLKVRWTFVSTDRSGTEKVLEAPVYEYSHLSSYLFEVDGCTPLIILRNIRTIR